MPLDINNPAFRLALQHVEELNTPRQWAEMEVLIWETTYAIRIRYGAIWSDTRREIAIATRSYGVDNDGKAFYSSHTHV